MEIFGRSRFPRIGELPYLLTLAPRGFYWFQLVKDGPDDDVSRPSPRATWPRSTSRRSTTGSSPSAGSRSKAREVAHIDVARRVAAARPSPPLLRARAWSRRASRRGTHETYQVPLGLRPADDGWTERVILEADGWTVYDALADPAHGRELLHRMRANARGRRSSQDEFVFRWAESAGAGPAGPSTCARWASSSPTRRSSSATS